MGDARVGFHGNAYATGSVNRSVDSSRAASIVRTSAHTPRWTPPEDAVLLEHGARRGAPALAELLLFAGFVQSLPSIRFRLHELALCSAERCPCPATRGSAL